MLSYLKTSVFAFLCLQCAVSQTFFGRQNQFCQTPDGSRGQCVVIDQCEPLRTLLLRGRLTSQVRYFLQASHCGFQGQRPQVCCPTPQQPQVATTTTTTRRPGTDRRPPTPRPQPGGRSNGLQEAREICGTEINSRIVNGERTAVGEFPWMTLLKYSTRNGESFQCGGALITNRYVLTAAHCIVDIPRSWKLLGVRLGEHDIDQDPDCEDFRLNKVCAPSPQDFNVEPIIHPNYDSRNRNKYNDIALLRLDRPATFSDYVKPICLPEGELTSRTFADNNLTVAGWGRTEQGQSSKVKLKVSLPVMTNADCAPIYSRQISLTDSQMCAGGVRGKDSCKGDSGGPLMTPRGIANEPRWYVVGVVSIGPEKCGSEGRPGIYTRVGDFADWISQEVRK